MPATNPAQVFDRLEKAQAAWTRGGATLVVAETGSQGTTHVRFRLDLDGAGGATLRVQTPDQGKSAATDQVYVLKGASVTGVDLLAGERLRRPAPDRGSVGLRLTAVLGGLNDAVGFITTPEVRERYLAPLRVLGGWQATSTTLVRRTTAVGKASSTRLDLDPVGRLRRLHVELPGSRVDWAIAYGPERSLATPRNLRLVDAFTARPRPPRFANAQAKAAGERTMLALGRLQSGTVRIDDAATLSFSGRRVRYVAGSLGYAYDGRVLTVVTPGAAYRGPCSRAAVIDQVASTLGTVDPLARSVLVRTTPFGDLFPPEAKVRLVTDAMVFAGQPCNVMDIRAPRFRASVFARKTDGLPLSVESVALNDRGAEVATTRRTLEWSSVGQSLPAGLFALPLRPNATLLPLPARKATGP